VIIVIVIAAVLAAGTVILGLYVFGTFPPRSTYAATVHVDSTDTPCIYRGQSPTNVYWLVATVSVNNTGDGLLSPTRSDWSLESTAGNLIAQPVSQFYTPPMVPPGQVRILTLVFDMGSTFGGSAKVILTLPNGNGTAGAVSVPQWSIGISFGRTGDATNWSLIFTTVPPCLTTTETQLTINNGGGATSLAPTALSSLSYGTNHAAYVEYSPGGLVHVGDRLLISTSTYPSGYSYTISDGSANLAQGTFA